MFNIGYRTLKTAVGASLAVLVAQLLQLEFFAAAGILTILCIQKTRKKSFQSAWERLLACLLGIAVSGIVFEIAGYHFISVAVVLLLFIPLTVRLGITSGIVTSTVIMFHIYTIADLSAGLILNELALISIGVGMALLMNIYMPSNEKILDGYQRELESLYAKIFHEFATYIRYGDNRWSGKEVTDASELLQNAKNLAMQNLENHILRYEDSYYHYFKMREKQLDIIERMMPLLTSIDYHVEQADMLAAFMDDLGEGVHPANTAYLFIEKLEDLQESFKSMPLPDTREEFEARSALAHLVRELEQYLLIKQQFKVTENYGVFESKK